MIVQSSSGRYMQKKRYLLLIALSLPATGRCEEMYESKGVCILGVFILINGVSSLPQKEESGLI